MRFLLVGVALLFGLLLAVAFYQVGLLRPAQKPEQKYLDNAQYCETDADCVVDGDNCKAVNTYHDKESRFQCQWETCGAVCRERLCEVKTQCG